MTAGIIKTSDGRWSPVSRSNRMRSLWLAALFALVIVLLAASVTVGTRNVGWDDVAAAMGGAQNNIDRASVALRIPRTVLALLAGGALGLAGAIMQGVTRNPLADPGILGVNMGASLAVVVGVAWFGMSSLYAYIWVAILGAGCAAIFVYAIGSLGRGGATPLKMALAGAATSVAFASMVIAVVLPRGDIAGGIHSWQIGGVGGATYERILPVLPFLLVGFVISCCRPENSTLLHSVTSWRPGSAKASQPRAPLLPSAPSFSAVRRPPYAGRSAFSGWSYHISAASWLAWTIGGCCLFRRSQARVSCSRRTFSGESSRAPQRST